MHLQVIQIDNPEVNIKLKHIKQGRSLQVLNVVRTNKYIYLQCI